MKIFSRLGIQEHPMRRRIGKENGQQGERQRLEREGMEEKRQTIFSFFFINFNWINGHFCFLLLQVYFMCRITIIFYGVS